MDVFGNLAEILFQPSGFGPATDFLRQAVQQGGRGFIKQRAKVRAPAGRDFPGEQGANQFIFRQRIPVADVRGGAGHADEIRCGVFLCGLNGQREAHLIQYGAKFFYAQIGKQPVFKLVQRRARDLRGMSELRLGQPPFKPGLADLVADVL